MADEIISFSMPQMEDDLDICEELSLVLKARGFKEIDIDIQYDTNMIIYRFQKVRHER